jgi:hypothetical protein
VNLIQVVIKFSMMFRPALRHTQPPVIWVMGLLGGKVAGAWFDLLPPSSARLKMGWS